MRGLFLKGVEGGGGGHVPPDFQKWEHKWVCAPPPPHFWTEQMF